MQRRIDGIFRFYRKFFKVYINDIVVYSKILNKYLYYLRKILDVFSRFKIRLSPRKSFLGYLFVKLLKQKIDGLGLITAENKLKAISSLSFFYILKKLKIYLKITG